MPGADAHAWLRRGHSVFGKLVAILLVMAASLLLLVAGFFLLYISPRLNDSIDRVVQEYARVVAASQPDAATARRLVERLDVQIRYEGPAGTWSTLDRLPPIARARAVPNGTVDPRRYYVVDAPDGGHYLFAWTFTDRVRTAHYAVLFVLLALMIAVVVATHEVLRRLLQPLQELADGVARLGDGQLDALVAKRSEDEFGALTDAFNAMVGRVRTMVRARDQLLLDVSHELRSPITRLRVAAELTGDGDLKARMVADLAEMETMVGELVELERLRDGRSLRREPRDLVALLDPIVRGVADRPPGTRLIAVGPVVAEVDGAQFAIAIRNLVENAVAYSRPDSGAIAVTVASAASGVRVRVVDDGPGIPPDDLPNLFEPFFRVDRSRSKRTGGYGLGLSISRRIVEAHGGTLVAENNAGGGATFTVALPAAQSRPGSLPATS